MTPTNTLIHGLGGAGKSITATLLAVALSKEQHDGAPITLMDTENIAEFIKPICAVEGVPLFIEPSRSFVDMRDALPRAVDRGCCAFLVDHYDGVHSELVQAQTLALGLVGRQKAYHHREELIRLWDAWVALYRVTPLHMIFTARQAFLWGDDETPEGDPVKVKLATKARGDADANYEPNLLIEMEKIESFTRDRGSRRKIGQIRHVARIVKDRRMVLNGLSFTWSDLNGYTKPGGYKAVWKALAPHFVHDPRSGPGGVLRPESAPRDSRALFHPVTGESSFTERTRRVTIALEEFQATLRVIWPGETHEEKRFRNLTQQTLLDTRSWTKAATLLPELLESAVDALYIFESDGSNKQQEASVIAALQAAKDQQAEKALAF